MTELLGYENFQKINLLSDKFEIINWHSIEFYCDDANTTSKRLGCIALGMKEVAYSNMTSGNNLYTSYILQSNQIRFIFTSSYNFINNNNNNMINESNRNCYSSPHPYFDVDTYYSFFRKHGLGVYAIALEVNDCIEAFNIIKNNDAEIILEPQILNDIETNQQCIIAEVKLYGDVILRLISGNFEGSFLPGYIENIDENDNNNNNNYIDLTYGLERIDHAVGNVNSLIDAVSYIKKITGFHEFAQFTSKDVGTNKSGLNNMVLADNSELILFPINEPTYGTERKSQIKMFLDHNNGNGVQHLALKTNNIINTIKKMKEKLYYGGLDFMPVPSSDYYQTIVKDRINLYKDKINLEFLNDENLQELENLGVLIDINDEGILLQKFTQPLGDRPTIFIEIIQRIGCDHDENGLLIDQKGGCGGFGKGNFATAFESIERYEMLIEKNETKN